MSCGIYKIINKIDKKYYVGSSIDIFKRWATHKYLLSKDKHPNRHLQRAWNTHGENNFAFLIVQEVENDEDLGEFEQWYLTRAERESPECYNLSFVADRVDMTPETREKIKFKALSRFRNPHNHPLYGKSPSPETRRKIGDGNRGKVVGLWSRFKISMAHASSSKKSKYFIDPSGVKLKPRKTAKRGGENNPRFDPSFYHFVNPVTKQTFVGTRFDFHRLFKLNRGSICDLVNSKCKQRNGWRVLNPRKTL